MVLTRMMMMMMGKVEKGEGMTDVLKVELVMNNGGERDLVVVYIPHKINARDGRGEYGNGKRHIQLFKEYDRKQ